MELRDQIATFQPFNEQESQDKYLLLRALDTDPHCFERSAQAHFTCSIWVVDPACSKTLMVYHNIYKSWSWIGGHADGECDLAAVALRELEEETGVANARIVSAEDLCSFDSWVDVFQRGGSQECSLQKCNLETPNHQDQPPQAILRQNNSPIFSLEVLTVDGHEKKGCYVSSHLHLNVTYLAVADLNNSLRVKSDENSGVKWVPLDEAISFSDEPWIRDRIYRKLIKKLRAKN